MALVTVNDDETEDFQSRPRWSAGKKMDAVLRLLRGESLEALSRELGVGGSPPGRLAGRLLGGRQGEPQGTPAAQRRGPQLREAERKIGGSWD